MRLLDLIIRTAECIFLAVFFVSLLPNGIRWFITEWKSCK